MTHRSITLLACTTLLLCACGDVPASDSGVDISSTVGEPECSSDEDCAEVCEQYAETFGAPSGPRSLDAEACEASTIIHGEPGAEDSQHIDAGCVCRVLNGGTITIHGEVGLECVYLGHARHCLYHPSEFPGCTVGDASSCAASCADLAERIRVDSETEYDVNVVSGSCINSSSCDCEWEVDGKCFSTTTYTHEDCLAE